MILLQQSPIQLPFITAGVDEVGRGPLAGPVVAAAVILAPDHPIQGLKDSKCLSDKQRQVLAEEIQKYALAFALGRAEVSEIEELNILQASLLAMQRAVLSLPIAPEQVVVDGQYVPKIPYPVTAIIRGDQIVPAISAASILAKVNRDREMKDWDRKYPGYGFAAHKGYPTRFHLTALQQLGITPIHRRTFAPVKVYVK